MVADEIDEFVKIVMEQVSDTDENDVRAEFEKYRDGFGLL